MEANTSEPFTTRSLGCDCEPIDHQNLNPAIALVNEVKAFIISEESNNEFSAVTLSATSDRYGAVRWTTNLHSQWAILTTAAQLNSTAGALLFA